MDDLMKGDIEIMKKEVSNENWRNSPQDAIQLIQSGFVMIIGLLVAVIGLIILLNYSSPLWGYGLMTWRWKTAISPTRTSAVSWPSSMSCLILYLWMRPRPIIRKAPIDFETKCPEVERGKRAASFGCCPLAFPHYEREAI